MSKSKVILQFIETRVATKSVVALEFNEIPCHIAWLLPALPCKEKWYSVGVMIGPMPVLNL